MALTPDIQKRLMAFAKGNYDVIIPNFFYGSNECDLFRITHSDYVFEYEIKVSRGDFFADFKKESRDCRKHEMLATGTGDNCPNRFFYVVPEGMISKEECPKYAGLLYYSGSRWFDVQKNAPLIHKRKVSFEVYRDVCRTLSSRDQGHRARIAEIRNTDFDKEMARMKRELDAVKKEKQELAMRLLTETRNIRKVV